MENKRVVLRTGDAGDIITAKNINMNANFNEGSIGVSFVKELKLADDTTEDIGGSFSFYGGNFAVDSADDATKAKQQRAQTAINAIYSAIITYLQAEEAALEATED